MCQRTSVTQRNDCIRSVSTYHLPGQAVKTQV